MLTGFIDIDVDINEIKDLKYNKASLSVDALSQYAKSGHNLDQIILYNYFEPNPMPFSTDDLKEHFKLYNTTIAVNWCKPGQYLPLHQDLYKKWINLHNFFDIDRIVRYIVMLEDHIPGQFLQIDNQVINNWKAGDYFGWHGDTVHAIYNFSFSDRYALQVTGHV